MDRAILAAIIDKFDGGPVGVESLAAAVGDEPDTIGEVYAPYLLQEAFIARIARGRIATQRAYSHLGRIRRAVCCGRTAATRARRFRRILRDSHRGSRLTLGIISLLIKPLYPS